jgi:NAD(P)-dependent dehydrogenase (short-subunit alcohol dehydrogenase family)
MTDSTSRGTEIAIVTGGGSGIGAAVSRKLAAKNMTVIVADVDLSRAQALCNAIIGTGRALPAEVDVTSPESVDALIEYALKAGGGEIKYLVNCAGVNSLHGIFELEMAEWRRVIDVNLTGTFNVCQKAARAMAATGGGAIVNISSVSANVAFPKRAHYSASKAGVSALTRALAIELAPYQVRVNAVAPGPVATNLIPELTESADFRRQVTKGIPAQRMGTAEEIADTIRFLLSDRASYINGTVLSIDGGLLASRP